MQKRTLPCAARDDGALQFPSRLYLREPTHGETQRIEASGRTNLITFTEARQLCCPRYENRRVRLQVAEGRQVQWASRRPRRRTLQLLLLP